MKNALVTGTVGVLFGFTVDRIGFGDWGEVHRMLVRKRPLANSKAAPQKF